jgi:dipeptidyl aminopeptidase/acylaminoacyl peptidase
MLATLADRGVRVLAIHTGALGPRYNHADQLFELFPELRGRLDAAYFPDANHMFTERAAQARLIAAAAAWLGRTFP